MRRLAATLACALVLTSLIATAPSASGATARAVASWSMVPQSKDADGDGIIDGDGGVPRRGPLSISPSSTFVGAGNRIAQPAERLIDGSLSWYLSDRGFPVQLDACGSTGSRYRWRASTAQGTALSTPWKRLALGSCQRSVFLPEGRYELTLEVRSRSSTDTQVVNATVRNILIVALGDSYASGEGNPRNVEAWVRSGEGSLSPYWDDQPCHRSARGAPAQAAMLLEQASPLTSVTLVDVACSGATVNSGILGAQRDAGLAASQIELARAIVGARPVDLVTLSVGGNDVGFTNVLETCAFRTDCPLVRASGPPLNSYPRLQDGVQAETAALPAKYQRIAACLGGASCLLADGRVVPPIVLSPTARVLPTLYPDITRAADGSPCEYLTIDRKDFAWAGATILNPSPPNPYPYPLANGSTASLPVTAGSLNQQVTAAGSRPGWQAVRSIWTATGQSEVGHGVCAGTEAWVFGATLLSSMPSASFHPNVEGQRRMAIAISKAMVVALAS